MCTIRTLLSPQAPWRGSPPHVYRHAPLQSLRPLHVPLIVGTENGLSSLLQSRRNQKRTRNDSGDPPKLRIVGGAIHSAIQLDQSFLRPSIEIVEDLVVVLFVRVEGSKRTLGRAVLCRISRDNFTAHVTGVVAATPGRSRVAGEIHDAWFARTREREQKRGLD